MPAAEIPSALERFAETGRVLYVAAHPDDENTQLITYLARGRGYRTAYLSLTRGDGGQNVLGSDFGSKLGVARTEELLEARRLDGGQQFFSRAVDFGFSKDYRETLSIWNRQEVLSDVVRVIREFQPDVIITRFSLTPGGTHGHHTASAVLALEAFKLAGDAKAFPEQLGELKPWQAKRIFWNGFNRGEPEKADTIKIDASGTDPVRGISFAELAGQSRAQHKTQGFGNFSGPASAGPRWESFQLLAGDAATKDILDGVDTSWARFPGGADIGGEVKKISTAFSAQNPSASVPALLQLRDRVRELGTDPRVDEKLRALDAIVQCCLGLQLETTLPQAEVVAGEKISLRFAATLRGALPIRWVAVRYPTLHHELRIGKDLKMDESLARDADVKLPAGTPLSQPYWLQSEPQVGTFKVADATMIGRPENPPVLPVEYIFKVGNETLVVNDEPVQSAPPETRSDLRERLSVIAPVALRFVSEVQLFAPSEVRTLEVELAPVREGLEGKLRLQAPVGWRVSPAQSFRLGGAGSVQRISFSVTAPSAPTVAQFTAITEIQGKTYDTQRVELRYGHIPPMVLQPPANLKAVVLNLAKRGQRVGYLPGAGDNVAEALRQIGYDVTTLSGDDLSAEHLRGLDAVVVGVRALNTRTDLVGKWSALFAFAEGGGNVIVQYNNPNGLKVEKVAPYELHLSGDRVTDETAAVTWLAPGSPVLNTPNKLTQEDFAGWVQERGLYFPNRWDAHFTPIFACNDPGESPMKGSLLVASYGRGYFVYTGLAFFRQLPAGVPGAFRLLANLVSLGK